jgi:hypothetical protein
LAEVQVRNTLFKVSAKFLINKKIGSGSVGDTTKKPSKGDEEYADEVCFFIVYCVLVASQSCNKKNNFIPI